MKSANRALDRRSFLRLSAVIPVLPLLPSWIKASPKMRSVQFTVRSGRRRVGIKIVEPTSGRFFLSAREMGGKRLVLVPLGRARTKQAKASQVREFKLKNGSQFRVGISAEAKISSNLKQVHFGSLEVPGNNNPVSSQGFWDWLGGVVNDVLSGIGAVLTWMTGGEGFFKLSGGGELWIEKGTIVYEPGIGLKLEPGMEEDPLVWY